MVDTESVAKHLLKPLSYLYRQGDFRQEIEHLLVALQCLFDEMDVYLRLAARRYAAQQHHVLFQELEQYVVVCLLLCCRQSLHVVELRHSATVQTSHLLLVGHEHLLVQQLLHDSRCGMRFVYQFVFRHLHHRFVGAVAHNGVPVGECQICVECLELCQCSLQHAESDV